MKIVFLGTSAMQPTKERGLSSILFSYGFENILIDCGEGTQRQMKVWGLKPTKLTRVLISHLHGDHIFGLPGLLHYLKANEYTGTLEIYGPRGLNEVFNHMVGFAGRPEINVKVNEIDEGIFFKNEDFALEAKKLNHTVTCYGYNILENEKRKINIAYLKKFGLTKHPLLGKLQRGEGIVWNGKKITVKEGTIAMKGKKVTFICDTKFDERCIELAKNADLLIAEATFLEDKKDKADEYKHLTAKQAALIAKKANVKKLVLNHFSQRYKDANEIKKEAAAVFKNTECSRDFMELTL